MFPQQKVGGREAEIILPTSQWSEHKCRNLKSIKHYVHSAQVKDGKDERKKNSKEITQSSKISYM